MPTHVTEKQINSFPNNIVLATCCTSLDLNAHTGTGIQSVKIKHNTSVPLRGTKFSSVF